LPWIAKYVQNVCLYVSVVYVHMQETFCVYVSSFYVIMWVFAASINVGYQKADHIHVAIVDLLCSSLSKYGMYCKCNAIL